MAALAASDAEMVRRVCDNALALGGKDEGAPGPRGSGFYAGYFRDLDGNKLNCFCMGADDRTPDGAGRAAAIYLCK